MALAHRQALAPFTHPCLDPIGQPLHPGRQAEGVDGGGYLVVGCPRPSVGDIRSNRRIKQEAVLRHHPDAASTIFGGGIAQVHPTDQDLTTSGVGQPGKEPSECGFPRAGLADDGHRGTGRHLHVDPMEHPPTCPVLELDGLHPHSQCPDRQGHRHHRVD